MRVGLISGEYPPMQGGVGAYSRILAHELVTQGIESIHILSGPEAEETSSSVQLSRITGKWGPNSLRRARSWARENHLDVINLQFETAAYGMSPWVHFLPEALGNIPLVTTFHDLLFPYLFPKAGPLRPWIVRRLARTSTGVIATNHEDLTRLSDLPNARLIPIGSNIPSTPLDFEADTYRAKVGADKQTSLIGYFGFMNHSKGVDTLLEAIATICQNDENVRLLMIGGRTGSDPANAAYADQIDALINRLGLAEFIHWTGFVHDLEVSSYIAACDLVVLPFRDGASYRRGSLMAAISLGAPTITTQPAVEIPAFRHGENMLLIPPNDAESLVNALRRALNDQQLRRQLQIGIQKIADLFAWDTIAREYISFFDSLLTSGSRSS